ncbi:reverse transcriptase domain-containing protein [Tanacetum coccineum]
MVETLIGNITNYAETSYELTIKRVYDGCVEIDVFSLHPGTSFYSTRSPSRKAVALNKKELKQNSGKEQPKAAKKGGTSGKDKALAIRMVQPWERVARQKITQSFSPNTEILFLPLDEDEGTKGPMIIEVEIGGHCIHRMYVDGGSASDILYEHCFNRLHPEIKNQLVSATTPLIGFSGDIIWPIGQIQLLVRIGDEEHFASAWMNFVVVRSPSPYNRIIGRPGVRNLQAVPSTKKLPIEGGVITLKSSRLVPLECALVSRPEETLPATNPTVEERVKVAINPQYLEQTKRGQAVDRNQAIQEEVGKLVEAGIMKKVHYHDWLSNPVMSVPLEEGMFLGYKVNTKGLKVCPDKVERWSKSPYPRNVMKGHTKVKQKARKPEIVERPEEDSPNTLMEVEEELLEPWILFTDGSSSTDGFEAGLIFINPKGMEFNYALRFRFNATNNEAEYEALIAGLRIAEQIEKVQTLTSSFKAFSIRQVLRSENKKDDALSKIASTSFAHLSKQVLVEELKEKSISEVEILAAIEEEEDTWMTPIFKYLTEETLPADVKQARADHFKRTTFEEKYTKDLVACMQGIDIAGPFLEGPGKVKFLIVAIDYFTKWIEAKPVATITGNQIKKFVWDKIVCRFGLPGKIISDNGKQFWDNPFKDCLGKGIKARLDARSKNWMEELPHVLRAHRTMIKSSNGDTPFSLTYGTKAVILAEIGMPTLRTTEVDLVQNDEALEINLDLLEEKREQAAIGEAKCKAKIEKYYNSKVRSASFKPGDLVYRNNDASRTEDTGKLGPKWEGPYEVTESLGKGAYKLRDRDGKQLPRTWNVSNLKKCYIHKM